MKNWCCRIIIISSLWVWPCPLSAQTAVVKLTALELLPIQERQQRLYELAKGEGEAVIVVTTDQRVPQDVVDEIVSSDGFVAGSSVALT